MPRRNLFAALAILLAVGAVAWLLLSGPLLGEAETGAEETATEDYAPDATLHADGATDTEQPGTPSLVGRDNKDVDPDAGHGPVEVLVVNEVGTPLPGATVVARHANAIEIAIEQAEKAEGGDAPASLPVRTAVTDLNGKAVFAAVPYSGEWVVESPRHGAFGLQGMRFVSGKRGANQDMVKALHHMIYLRMAEKKKQDDVSRTLRKNASFDAGLANVLAVRKTVRGPSIRLEVHAGLPIRLTEHDAVTGTLLTPAAWAPWPQVGAPKDVVLRDLAVQSTAVTPGKSSSVSVRVSPHKGFIPARRTRFNNTYVSPLARELLARTPKHPQAEVMVTLPDGVPLTDGKAWKARYSIDSRHRGSAKASLDGFGRVSLSGLPFRPGQKIRVDGTIAKEGRLIARGQFGFDAGAPVVLEATWHPYRKRKAATASAERTAKLEAMRAALETELAEMTKMTDQITKQVEADARAKALDALGATVNLNGVGGVVIDLNPDAAGHGAIPSEISKDKGYVEVLVRRPDGKPAQGATVYVGPTRRVLDKHGRAALGPFQPGTFSVRVLGAGAVLATQLEVKGGVATPLELDAHTGGRVNVLVVDEEGNALPFAEVHVTQPSQLGYADLHEGVQRIDPFVDDIGRRTFYNLEVGEVTLRARYGSRTVTTKVNVLESKTVAARLVIAWPKPKKLDAGSKKSQDAINRIKASKEALKELLKARKKMDEEMQRRAGGR